MLIKFVRAAGKRFEFIDVKAGTCAVHEGTARNSLSIDGVNLIFDKTGLFLGFGVSRDPYELVVEARDRIEAARVTGDA